MLTTAILLTIPLVIAQMRRLNYKPVTPVIKTTTIKNPKQTKTKVSKTTTEWPYVKIEFPVIEYCEAE